MCTYTAPAARPASCAGLATLPAPAQRGGRARTLLSTAQYFPLNEIERIYLGTERALDSAKPTASYIAEIVESYFLVIRIMIRFVKILLKYNHYL